MGYFEDLASRSFKTTEDGRRLFFPWGVFGRGYVIASEDDYQLLRTQMKAYTVIANVCVCGLVLCQTYTVAGAVVAAAVMIVLIGWYCVWMWFVLRRLDVTDEQLERLSLRKSLDALKPIGPWTVQDPADTSSRKTCD